MGAKEDIEASLRERTVTKIQGQPTDRTLTQLRRELTKIAASVPTNLGGGKHGHVGIVIPDAKYVLVSDGGVSFTVPAHPGHYPASASDDPKIRAKEEAQHKGKLREFAECAGVLQVVKDFIVEAVDEEWLAEIEDELMGFEAKTPIEMLEHLEKRGGTLDFIDTTEIKGERDAPWDGNEHVVTYFNRIEQAVKQLERAKIVTDKQELLNQALYTFKESGELEQGLVNWTALAEPDKTWDKCKEHFSKEYSDRRRHALVEAKGAGFGSAANAREAGHAREDADRLDEMAQVTCEILQQMNEKNDEKFERMMQQMAKQNELLAKLSHAQAGQQAKSNSPQQGTPYEGKKVEWKDGEPHPVSGKIMRRCPHCKKLVTHKETNCLELEANASRRPSYWKSCKK